METAEQTAAGSIIRDRYVLAEPYDPNDEGVGTGPAWWAVDAMLHRTIVIAFDDPSPASDHEAAPIAPVATGEPNESAEPNMPDESSETTELGADEDQVGAAEAAPDAGGATLAAASVPTAGARARAGLGDVLDGGWYGGAFYRVYRLPFGVDGTPAVPAGVLAAVRAADDGPRSARAVAAAITGDAPPPAATPVASPTAPVDDITGVLALPLVAPAAPWTGDVNWMTAAEALHAPPQPEDPTVEVALPAPAITGQGPALSGAPAPLPLWSPPGGPTAPDPTALLPIPLLPPPPAPRSRSVRAPRPPISRPRRAVPKAAAGRAAGTSPRRTAQTAIPMAVVVGVVVVGGTVLQWWPSRDPQVGTPAVAAVQPAPPPTTEPVPIETEPPPVEITTTTIVTRPRPTTTTTVAETTTTAAPETTTTAAPTTTSTRATTTSTSTSRTTRTTRPANSGPGGEADNRGLRAESVGDDEDGDDDSDDSETAAG